MTAIPDGFNPTVGGDLYLSSVTAIPDGFNPTVGGDLYLSSGLKANVKKLSGPILVHLPVVKLSWQGGKYVKVDGIFTEVVSTKGKVSKVKRLNKQDEFYLITDGKGKWAHGETLKQAKTDLIYKLSGDIDISQFKRLSLTSTVTFEKGVQMYRAITGVCAFGVKEFVERKGISPTQKFTVAKIIEVTKGEYQSSTFKQFFNA